MVAFGRLMIVLGVLAGLSYLGLRRFLAARKREALEEDWNQGAGGALPLEAFLAQEMAAWNRSLPRKLLWGVVVLPYLIVVALAYFLN